MSPPPCCSVARAASGPTFFAPSRLHPGTDDNMNAQVTIAPAASEPTRTLRCSRLEPYDECVGVPGGRRNAAPERTGSGLDRPVLDRLTLSPYE